MKASQSVLDFLSSHNIKCIKDKHYLFIDFWDMIDFGEIFKEYLDKADPFETAIYKNYCIVPVDKISQFYEIDIANFVNS